MQIEQLAALAALLRFFRRGEFPLGQRDAALLGDGFDCFGKADVVNLLHEGEDVARLVAAEAVVELACCVNGKRGRLFPVEGAKSDIVLPAGFLQRDVFADDADDVRLLLDELGEV